MNVFELVGPQRLEIRDEPIPAPQQHELLIRTRRSAVSIGTEVWRYINFGHYGGEGGRCGYNSIGEVVDIGADVSAFAAGDLVFTGQPHSEYVVASAARAVKVPAGIDLDAAVFSYLPTLSLHALRASAYGLGENVLVVGLGVVGALGALLARVVGARVASLEVEATRRELGERLHAGPVFDPNDLMTERALDEYFGEPGPDVIIETSQAWEGLVDAIKRARSSSRLALVGIYRTEPPPDLAAEILRSTVMNRDHFHNQRVKIIGCSNDAAGDFPSDVVRWTAIRNISYVLSQMSTGAFDPRPIITHRLRWNELETVYRDVAHGDRSYVGVTLNWDNGPVQE